MATSAPPGAQNPFSNSSLERNWLLAQTRLLEQLALGTPSEDVFGQLLTSVATVLPDMHCSILLRDELKHTLNPLIQSEGFPPFYLDALRDLPIAEGVGSCGTAASTGERVIVEDIASHPYWADYRELAARAGFAACWSQPIRSQAGNVVGTFGLYYDHPRAPTDLESLLIESAAHLAGSVLARDQYLQEIIEREKRFRALIENVPVGIHEVRVDGRLLWINPASYRMFDVSDTDARQEHYYLDTVHPLDKPKVKAAFDQACAGNVGTYTFRNESMRYFSGSCVPLMNAYGEVDRLIGIVEDVTERALAEQALQQEHDLLEHRVRERTAELEEAIAELRNLEIDLNTIIDASPDPLFILDAAGILRRVSSGVVECLGYSREEILGRDVDILRPAESRHENKTQRNKFYRSLAEGAEVETIHEVVARTKQGREVPMEVRVSPIKLSGEQYFALAARDITAHLARTAALQTLTTKAERATAAKAIFLAAASHDLRQPLQSVGLYLSVLEKQLQTSEAREIGAKMRTSLDVMAQLLDALLDLANLESGAMAVDRRDAALDPLLQQIESSCQPQAAQKALNLVVDKTDFIVHTDLALLQRVLANFVANAINYTEAGEVRVSVARCGEKLEISVSDTGCGIPADRLEEIFDEYVQVDNPVRDRRKGLGLGLAIVKHISRTLACPVGVESTPGVGSTFRVTVPLAVSQTRTMETGVETPSHSTLQAARVLVIEDDPEVLAATTMLLEAQSFAVYTATTGGEAMQLIQSGVRPDVILSDYRLPGENGVELLRHLRAAMACDTACVFLTGDSAAEKIREARLVRTHVFTKPVVPDDLIALIQRILK